ncbi:MAG: 2Fe-2S iron-sulfur cluster binding domain-containing protein [Flavobacteriales bacterium]|nr:2Fe-2S iron-sulfur cluster binding domain-containing protein [Flavobacteriales bacterium]
MSQFISLKVKEVRRETENAVSVAFDLSDDQQRQFQYKPGQYITIRRSIGGEDVRRSYSLSSAPHEHDFRIAVKKIEGGKMSGYCNDTLTDGTVLDVMLPQGNFVLNAENGKHYVAFAAGSGITPVISMVKSTLKNTDSKFTLFYGNKSAQLTIFKNELDALKNTYPDRFQLNYIYSQQESSDRLFEGRITRQKFEELIRADAGLLKADGFFMCGPEQMIMDVKEGLAYLGVHAEKIHFELFTTPVATSPNTPADRSDFTGVSQVTVIMDGEEFELELAADGDFILDAAMDAGADVPFSCKGAVCCTCKAQVVEGKAIMDMNYSLSDSEVEDGFILTCQAHPASEKVVIDYDVV